MNIPITRGTTGLRTENDPVRSAYNKKTGGLSDLAACMDIDVSDARRPSRRKGKKRLITGNWHSLFPVNDQYCLMVQDDALSVTSDLVTATGIRNVTVGARVSYCLLDNTVYYVNGFEIGQVNNQISSPWVKPNELISNNKTRIFQGPPIGQRIAYYKGRMYIAQGDKIWYSEPYGPDLWSMSDSFLPFESVTKMVRPVAGGLYISDEYDTWFLAGAGPGDFNWDKVDPLPALPWSDSEMLGTMMMTKSGDYMFISGKVVSACWMTAQGLVYGGPTGSIEKITEGKIDLPGNEYTSGATGINGTTLIGVAL